MAFQDIKTLFKYQVSDTKQSYNNQLTTTFVSPIHENIHCTNFCYLETMEMINKGEEKEDGLKEKLTRRIRA